MKQSGKKTRRYIHTQDVSNVFAIPLFYLILFFRPLENNYPLAILPHVCELYNF